GEHSESRIGGYAETRTMRGKRDRARRNSRSGSRREPLDDAPAMAHRKPAPLNVRSNPKLRTTVRIRSPATAPSLGLRSLASPNRSDTADGDRRGEGDRQGSWRRTAIPRAGLSRARDARHSDRDAAH